VNFFSYTVVISSNFNNNNTQPLHGHVVDEGDENNRQITGAPPASIMTRKH